MHLSITWDSASGQTDVYLNGQLKWTCYNIALNREISTAGLFLLGQSHKENFYKKQNKKEIYTPSTKHATKLEPIKDNEFSFDSLPSESSEKTNSQFDEKYSFVGRLFNFNIWNHIKPASSILNVYKDCKLAHCGNATQWSDFRQGTRGDVIMKWPTDLLWKRDCFSENFQHESCDRFCVKEIGPICREHIEKNIRWPLTKANETFRVKCFPHFNDSNKYAYRQCNQNNKSSNEYSLDYLSKRAVSNWQSANVDECVQEPLIKLKNDVFVFHTTDNFDETKILIYLNKLYDLTIQLIKSNLNNQRSVFDLNTIIDTMFYLINAQVICQKNINS